MAIQKDPQSPIRSISTPEFGLEKVRRLWPPVLRLPFKISTLPTNCKKNKVRKHIYIDAKCVRKYLLKIIRVKK